MYAMVLRSAGIDDIQLDDLMGYLSSKYMSIVFKFGPVAQLDSSPLRTSILTSSMNLTANFFRFKRADLHTLRELLRFPARVKFDNGSKMSGEEVFLRGLYELASGETKHKISTNMFGREWTIQSIITPSSLTL